MSAQGIQRWWWVRHAPVIDFNGQISGQLDVDVDCSDTEAFAALARMLPPGRVIATPLMRTARTFEAVREAGLDLVEPVIEPGFMEQHFGDWQGLAWPEMQVRDPDAYDAFWQNPCGNRTPGGESFIDQMSRVYAAIEGYLGEGEDTAADTVVFAHGGTIRAAVAHALALSPEQAMSIAVDNLSVTRLDHIPDGTLRGRGGSWRVVYVNRPPRLDSIDSA